jgi:hypothetical protein
MIGQIRAFYGQMDASVRRAEGEWLMRVGAMRDGSHAFTVGESTRRTVLARIAGPAEVYHRPWP